VLSAKHRIVLGPHWPGVLVTLALIWGGTVLNLQVIDTKYNSGTGTHGWMRLLVYTLCTLTLVLFLKTATTEPGIVTSVPRDFSAVPGVDDDDEGAVDAERPTPAAKDLGSLVFCDICEIYSEEKDYVRHCYDCQVCLERHDHHCPWVGMCVAKRNMPYFIAFNLSWMAFLSELLVLVFVVK
jgi:palmitoyltransferase ZDHHC9/14/18